ncbi:ras homolog, mTORC1 binding like 1 isoform X4 [Rhincodon typus]|nr:ras homolog, mTORC1 binding like 1 isoform X4 [Rhincodon typus]XP_048474990.1 ras homolog, mTORC1 binding like 1 isoform X4 [Rhincodon typus]XP_048474991.1 ras homolog, mTORC1 binding like 1 isoform X4 [Rhincodon typus]
MFSRSHTVDVHGYVLVYSVTSMKSFEVIKVIRSKLLDMVGKIQGTCLTLLRTVPVFKALNYIPNGFRCLCSRPSSPHYAPPLEPPCFCQMCRIPTVLVANKRDLSKQRVVQTEEGKKLADSWGAAFLESSAKQNDTTVQIFKMMIQEIEKADGCTQDKKCDMM